MENVSLCKATIELNCIWNANSFSALSFLPQAESTCGYCRASISIMLSESKRMLVTWLVTTCWVPLVILCDCSFLHHVCRKKILFLYMPLFSENFIGDFISYLSVLRNYAADFKSVDALCGCHVFENGSTPFISRLTVYGTIVIINWFIYRKLKNMRLPNVRIFMCVRR